MYYCYCYYAHMRDIDGKLLYFSNLCLDASVVTHLSLGLTQLFLPILLHADVLLLHKWWSNVKNIHHSQQAVWKVSFLSDCCLTAHYQSDHFLLLPQLQPGLIFQALYKLWASLLTVTLFSEMFIWLYSIWQIKCPIYEKWCHKHLNNENLFFGQFLLP